MEKQSLGYAEYRNEAARACLEAGIENPAAIPAAKKALHDVSMDFASYDGTIKPETITAVRAALADLRGEVK